GDVHHGLGEGFVQWHERITETGDAALVPERLAQGLADADGGVLHGVVHVHVRIALGAHGQVDQGVLAQGGEHVVVERHGGGYVHHSGAVEIDIHGHGGLRCAPLHVRRARIRHLLAHRPVTSSSAPRNAAMSSAVPIDVRRYPCGPVSLISTPRSSRPCQLLCPSSNTPKSTKLASDPATVHPRSRSQSTVSSRRRRSSATCACSRSRWSRAAQATAWVIAERWKDKRTMRRQPTSGAGAARYPRRAPSRAKAQYLVR